MRTSNLNTFNRDNCRSKNHIDGLNYFYFILIIVLALPVVNGMIDQMSEDGKLVESEKQLLTRQKRNLFGQRDQIRLDTISVCRSYIPFAFDVSTKLTSQQFNSMKSFLLLPFLSSIFSEDIQPAPFSTYSEQNHGYRNLVNVSNIADFVISSSQGSSSYSLITRPLKYFVDQDVTNLATTELAVNTVIFAGNSITSSDVPIVKNYTSILTEYSNTLTIVLMNSNIDQTNYKKIPGLNLVVWEKTEITITDIRNAMKCGSLPSASTVVYPSTSKSTSISTSPVSAYICRSYIPFSFDVSTKLTSEEFRSLKNFLLNTFLYSVFPFDIQPAPFSTYGEVNYGVRRQANVTNIINYVTVDAIEQPIPDSYITAPLEYFVSQNVVSLGSTDGLPVNTIIFAGDELVSSFVADAQNYTNQLTTNGNTLTVVLVNPNINQTNYKKISGFNIVLWSDTSTLISNIEKKMKCSGATRPTNQPTTPSTVPTTQTTAASPSSTIVSSMSSNPTMATTATNYLPCKSWISFSADNSMKLSAVNFQTQLSFISNAIGLINHPERLQFATLTDTTVPWQNSLSIHDIQNQINQTTQILTLTFSLRNSLSTLYTAYQSIVPTLTPPIGAIVFISDTSTPANYDGALNFATRLRNAGVTLTFVLLGSNVNQTLVNFADNYLTWTDLSQSQPDNWNALSLTAYSCPT